MATPKKGWEHFDLLGPLEKEIGVPAVLDTDVNGAALGEGAYGAGKGKSVVAYITVGTGIGVGLSIGGKPLHGLVHPEGGHMPVVRAPGDTYEGCCTFHRDSFLPAGCLEGYAAGPAIEKRWGEKGENLGSRSEVWEMEAFYLSQGVSQIALLCSPDIIILGGGRHAPGIPLPDGQGKGKGPDGTATSMHRSLTETSRTTSSRPLWETMQDLPVPAAWAMIG